MFIWLFKKCYFVYFWSLYTNKFITIVLDDILAKQKVFHFVKQSNLVEEPYCKFAFLNVIKILVDFTTTRNVYNTWMGLNVKNYWFLK